MTTQQPRHQGVTSTHQRRTRKAAVDLWATRCTCGWQTFTMSLAEADRRMAAHRAAVSA